MSDTVTLDSPAVTDTCGNVGHLVCCDDGVAMCGQDVSEEPWCAPGCRHVICPLCAHVEESGLPCPEPGCAPKAPAQPAVSVVWVKVGGMPE